MARALLAALAALACFLGACRACHQTTGVVAQLAEGGGEVARSVASAPEDWTGAKVGDGFAIGDAVHTLAKSTAKIAFVTGGAVRLRENTTIRFLVQGAAVRRIGVETGDAEIESGDEAMTIETSVGMAQLEPGSRVHVTSAKKEMRFEVVVGRAQFEGDSGPATSIAAGQRFLVSLGSAKLEPIDAPSIDATPPATPSGPRGDAAAPEDGSSVVAVQSDGVQAEVHGGGVRASATGTAARTPLAAGKTRLAEGTVLDVPSGASVDLTRGSERVSMVGQSEVEIGKASEALVRVRSGRAFVHTRTAGRRIDVPGGSIELTAAGPGEVQAEIDVDRRATRILSNQGVLLVRGARGTATVGAGQAATLDPQGKATTDETAVSAADVTVDAGESPVIHTPRPIASVRVRFPACSGDAILQVTSSGAVKRVFARGEGTSLAVVPLAGGSHRYAVRCVGDDDARADETGTIVVLHDSGAAHVARTAPKNAIDADGRHYSILYQNLLPQMTFRWPHAPPDGSVSLHVQRSGKPAQRFSATAGSVSLPTGTVREGSYTVWFDVDGRPDVRSPETAVAIAFDNAAPAAEVQEPLEGQAATPTIHVRGVASEGSAVTVSGIAVPMDAQSRFDGDVPGPATGDRSIAVRISHPTHGIHYYVRMFGARGQ